MAGRIHRQLCKLNHNPAFFTKQIEVLDRVLDSDDHLIGFVEGWLDWFKMETMVFATCSKVLFMSHGKDEFLFDEIRYENLVHLRKDLHLELSEIVFVCGSRSLSLTNIENISTAKEFYAEVNSRIASFKKEKSMAEA